MLLHEIFENLAKNYPNRVALSFENEPELTYGKVDELANQLANYFLTQKIQPGAKIAVRVKRSYDQVIALLAIFKIGAIYVPIAPPDFSTKNDISATVIKILKDANPDVLLGHSDTVSLLMNHLDHGHSVVFDSVLADIKKMSKDKPKVPASSPDDIAYIIYSSGTTGTPKGIPIKHKGLEYWANTQRQIFSHLNHNSKILGYISIGFDAHIWEYEMAWVAGGTLCIANQETCVDPNKLVQFMQAQGITDATLVPTVLRSINLKNCLPTLKAQGLHAIYSTGEKCTKDIVVACEGNNVELWNCYGPSEATFGISVSKASTNNLSADERVAIGFPYGEEVKIHVLDEQLKPVLENGIGELFIESPYLTAGYLNRPEETKKNFVNIVINNRLCNVFRTQDKVKLHYGQIFYYGRVSEITPVKIHGQLVDILEVEEQIRKQPNIQDVCVVVKEQKDRLFLVAYLVLKESNLFDKELLRQTLSFDLKHTAIPSNFFVLKELPRTSNGKLDRQFLLKMDEGQFVVNVNNNFINPQNFMEKKLFSIWKELLGMDNFSIASSFIELGGKSIQLMQLINHIKKNFDGVEIPVSKLIPLEQLTIEKLANIVYEAHCMQKMLPDILSKLRGQDEELPALFFVHPITGESAITYSKIASLLKTECAMYALNAPGLFNECDVTTSIQSIASILIAAMKNKQPHGPYNIIGWSFGGTVAWEIARQLEIMGETVAFLGLVDCVSPTLLTSNPDNYNAYLLELLTQLSKILNSPSLFKKDQLQKLSNLSPDEQVISAFETLYAKSPTDKLMLEVTKNNLLANNHYLPKCIKTTYPLIFSCEATQKMVQQYYPHVKIPEALGWSLPGQTKLSVCSEAFSPDHYSIITNAELAKEIDSHLPQRIKDSPPDSYLLETKKLEQKFEKKIEELQKEQLQQMRQLIFLILNNKAPKELLPMGLDANPDSSETKKQLTQFKFFNIKNSTNSNVSTDSNNNDNTNTTSDNASSTGEFN